jgi:hypothetical protein
MIKNLAYFPLQCALNSVPVMSAIIDSARAAGIQAQENSYNSDAAIIWSVLWNGRMARNKDIFEDYRRMGKPVVIVEVGALKRGITWKISVNHVNATGYYGHTENLDPMRPRKLGIELGTITNPNPGILIAAQHNRSLQVSDLQGQEAWINKTVASLKELTDRPVYVRQHPRSPLNQVLLTNNINITNPQQIEGTYDSFDINYNYHAVINYNSGPGIQGALAGTRVVVDKSSLAWPVGTPIENIADPYYIDRQQWLTEICHTEYTVEEIQQGLWLKRLEKAL